MSKIISIWGSPGSGKTITATKIAYELATKTGQDTILLSNDLLTPVLPVLFPHLNKKDEEKSIGKVLLKPDITQNDILYNSIAISSKLPLIVTGYNYADNVMTYPQFKLEKATELLLQMSQMAQFVVIDCTSSVMNNELTTASLIQADIVFQLYKPEHRSEVFFASKRPLLENENFGYSKFIRIMRAGIGKKFQAANEMSTTAGIKYTLPYSFSLVHQYESAEVFQPLHDDSFNKVVKTIIEDVILSAD